MTTSSVIESSTKSVIDSVVGNGTQTPPVSGDGIGVAIIGSTFVVG